MNTSSAITVKLQVPMDKEVRDKLEVRATELGFDSAQAFIRFWAKAQTDGRAVDFGEDQWGQPSAAAVHRLNTLADQALEQARVGKLKAYHSAQEFMKDLV